jgi:hypothetical protein
MISDVLKADIDGYANDLRRSSRLLALAKAGELSPAMVGRYYAGISYLISHTSSHLTLARELAIQHGARDLAAYFEEKLREEAGHEKWVEADLEKLDAIFGIPMSRVPPQGAKALLQSIEAGIRTAPYLYLAYILFSEYMTVSLGPEWVDALQTACGVPREAQTVIIRHIELDQRHVAEGLVELDELVADPALYEPLRKMLKDNMRHFSAFCDDVCNLAA